MLFSIVVPVYNVEKYIKECLQSLLNQTLEDFEIILVDDGSTDTSGKICDEYAQAYDNVKVIHKSNEGLLLARRTGISVCSGDYIIHCDSDDYIAKDALKTIKEAIERFHPDMVMYGYVVVDDNHTVREEHYTVFENYQIFDAVNKEELLIQLCSTTWLNNMVTKAVRRDLVDAESDYSNYKSVKMGEDLLQVIPLVGRCETFIYLASPLYFYRFNPAGMSKTIMRSYIDNHVMVSERMYDLLKNENVSETTLMSFYNRYVKDVYKYVLRYVKAGLSNEEYKELLYRISNNEIFHNAEERIGDWTKENKIMKKMIVPENYGLIRIMVKTILKNRI